MAKKIGHKDAVATVGALCMVAIVLIAVVAMIVLHFSSDSYRAISALGVSFIATSGAYAGLRLVDILANSEVKE